MAEKLTRKEKIALQKKSGGHSQNEILKTDERKRSLVRKLGILVALVGFLLYANTLSNDYVLDDHGLIKDNTQTKKGVSAIPEIFKSSYRFGMNITDHQLYRPLTKAMFALEWDIAPGNAALSHWVNVLFFALLCYVLFRTLNSYMNNNILIPFIASLLFAAHPLHTEVVANIKSRDEIVCFLFCLLSLWSLHNYLTKNSTRAFISGIGCYFIALFSKESAITFLVIVPMFYYFFTSAAKEKYIRTGLWMVGVTAIFLLIRSNILGNVESLTPVEDNSLAAIKDFFTQRANAIYILGVYLKLMVWPQTLISDGSYNHFPEVALTSWKFLVPFVILTGGLVYAIIKFKSKDVISFSIFYFFITASLVSNVVVLIGTNYGERLMFVPSLGFCLLIAVGLSKLIKSTISDEMLSKPGTHANVSPSQFVTSLKSFFSAYSKPLAIVLVIVVLFGIRTVGRNTDWKDNYTLYTTDVKKVPDSAHMLFYLANHITSDEFLDALPDSVSRVKSQREAIDYLTRAVTIYNEYADGFQRRGYIYSKLGFPQKAEEDYLRALKMNPTHPIVYNNYGTLCFDQRRYEEAINYFKQAVRYNPNYAHALNNVASVYGVYGQGEAEMITKDPVNKDQHTRAARENFESAISYFLLSIEADRDFDEPYRLIAVTYRNLGDNANGERYEKLYQEVTARKNAKN